MVRNKDTRLSKFHVSQQTLLDISVDEMRADVTDRSWDTQGSVTIGNISVLDHISLGKTMHILLLVCVEGVGWVVKLQVYVCMCARRL